MADTKYTVRKGDTVYKIAKRYHVSVQRVLDANGLTEKSILPLGKVLRIPAAKEQEQSARRDISSKQKRLHYAKVQAKESDRHIPWYESDAGDEKPEVDNKTDDNCRWSSLIQTAMTFRGTRYRYGGTSRGGFDCSGFTRYIYAKYGVTLPHSSRSQFAKGYAVKRDELKPGDLVFFQTSRAGISHVGIYIGNDQFVHASNIRRGVTVDSLSSGYYSKRYRGARRIQ